MDVLDPEKLDLGGTAVIEASAGTGKTYTITSLFLRLLLERGLRIDQILVVTYTRAATAELRDRIRQRLALALAAARGEASEDELAPRLCARAAHELGAARVVERLERALAGVDQAPVLTIHGFCQSVLRDHAFESGSGFEAELTPHAAPLLDEIACDYFMRELYETTPLRASVLAKEPETLRQLAVRVGGRDLRLLPEGVREGSFDLGAWRAAFTDAHALWRGERALVVELARSVRSIGQHALSWSSKLDELFAAEEHGAFAAAKSFAAFTRTGLRDKAKSGAPEHPFFDAAERLLELDRAFVEAKQGVELAFRRRFVDYLRGELARRTRERGVRTFDALLSDLDVALTGPSGDRLCARLRASYRAALVDEFQDTDPVQYRIFRRIFAGTGAPLLLIGDPKQAIYGFRGADLAAYLGARSDAGERVYTLDVNWRSDPPLVAALNALYAQVESPFLRAEIGYLPVRTPRGANARLCAGDGSAPLDLALVMPEDTSAEGLRRELARQLAADIARLLAAGHTRHDGARFVPLAASDIAVLCRTNREAALVQLALSQCGIASALSGDASVFDSEDVAQLERALSALAHPGGPRALRSFLGSLYGGLDAAELFALESDDARWEEQRARLQALHELWLSHGFMQALRGLVASYDVERKLLERSDGPRRITNLWHLAELLAEAALSERLGPLGLLRWLALVQRDEARRAELVGDAHELRLESGGDAVTLTTVHKSKGLEYPIVYCPFAWDATRLLEADKRLVRFHDPAHGEALSLDLGTSERDAHTALALEEALAEGLRLLYVALTRAQHRVTLVVPCTDKLAHSALGYTLFGGGDRHALKTRMLGLVKAGALEADLRARAEASHAFSVRALPRAQAPRGEPASTSSPAAASAAPPLTARPVRRALDVSYRVASFSALIARERNASAESGRDRDTDAREPELEARAGARERIDEERERTADSSLALATFPRGAVAGQLVHEVLEHCAFDGAHAQLEEVADRLVRARGYPPALAPGLALGLYRALHTPLDDTGFVLAEFAADARIHELEFVFPVETRLTPARLERAFRAQRAPAALPSYAGEVRRLGFDALHGYLRGYIDLVYRHADRFYVVDYKSNWLGPEPEDYAPPRLAQAMADHHYFLQSHLYALAVHRYLARRVPNYDYERHFGGVYYLFLRGMAPEHAPQTGVFFERPAPALIEALDGLLQAPKPRADEATP